MTVLYMDPDGGNDANNGTSFALRFKTLTNGATAARIAPGDVIRVMASPDPESVGNATWTYGSRTVTLPAAKTLTIHECDAAWTVAANVTGANPGGKVGTASQQLTVAAGFTTGKLAYAAVGGTVDYSAYTRVSMLLQSTVAHAAGVLQLKLCSDAIGDVPVNTFNLPAVGAASSSAWQAMVLDNAGALGNNIQSVALYATVDPGVPVIRMDNIVAAQSAATAGSLTHNSLLGKVHCLPWIASTAFALNDIRIPTAPSRTGFAYKVTAVAGAGNSAAAEPTWPLDIGATVVDGDLTWTRQDEEDSWYGIIGLSGTTVLLEAYQNATPAQGQGYSGPTGTETVATYKRECFLTLPATQTGSTPLNVVQDNGANENPITFTGGWDRTNMSTQVGQTWWNGQNNCGASVTATVARNNLIFHNWNCVKFNVGADLTGASSYRYELHHCHFNQGARGMNADTGCSYLKLRGVSANCNGTQGYDVHAMFGDYFACSANGNAGSGSPTVGFGVSGDVRMNHVFTRRNAGVAINAGNNAQSDISVRNWRSTGNTFSLQWGNVTTAADRIRYNLFNCDLAGDSAFTSESLFAAYGRTHAIYSSRHNRVADAHLITTFGGTIESATDQRYTPTGISWKFKPTSGLAAATARGRTVPLRLSIAKIACAANVPVYVRVMMRRDDTDIIGHMLVEGGTLRGVPDDVTTGDLTPLVNTWEQSAPLTFTPTEAGVAEVFFEVWDGSTTTTTSQFWIDDISVGTS